MHILDRKTNQVVIDFQLIYDIDSELHLDFYGDGLLRESEVLWHEPSCFQKVNTGMITALQENFDAYELFFQARLQAPSEVERLSELMTASILPVHRLCHKVSIELSMNKLNYSTLENLYDACTYMLSFKRFSDAAEKTFLNENDVGKTPSYLMRMLTALNRLDTEANDQAILSFTQRYGYLCSFTIKPGTLATIDGVRAFLKARTNSAMEKPSKQMKPARLFKQLAWYEELRHIYQLRALHLFRRAFEQLSLDIHESTLDTLKRRLHS